MKKIKLLVMSAILGTSLLVSTNVFAKDNVNVNRFSGKDRYETSSKIVSQGWQKSDYAILVNSQNFPDSIVSSPLAKRYNAPILLTDSNTLTDSTKEKLKELGVKCTFIIGGESVISSQIENDLESMKISTKRIWGKDRYETSVNVAKELGGVGVFIVSGDNFEDALSVSPIASEVQFPIILVSKDSIPNSVLNYVNNTVIRNNGQLNIVGGDDVLNNKIINQLKPTKVYNQPTKYERNLALIKDFKNQLNTDTVYVASDSTFADGLSGSALASKNSNPIILVGSTNQVSINNFINNGTINIGTVNILGGTGVISDNTVNNIIGNNPIPSNSNSNSSSNNSSNNYIIKATDGTQIDLKDYKGYVAGYEEKIRKLAYDVAPISIKVQEENGYIAILMAKNNDIDKIMDTPTVALLFYNNGKWGYTIINSVAMKDGNYVLQALRDYIPEKYRKDILTDQLNAFKDFQKVYDDNTSEVNSLIVNKGNKQFMSKSFRTNYGASNTLFSVAEGKEQQAFTTIMPKENNDTTNYNDKSNNQTNTQTNPITIDTNSVIGLKQTIIVPDTLFGTYEITINSVEKSNERNEFNDSNPVEVYKINYTYKLLSKGSADMGLFLYSPFNSVDSTGEAGYNYPNSTANDAKELKIIGSRCTADTFIGVNNKTTSLTLTLDYNTSNSSSYITFKVPTK